MAVVHRKVVMHLRSRSRTHLYTFQQYNFSSARGSAFYNFLLGIYLGCIEFRILEFSFRVAAEGCQAQHSSSLEWFRLRKSSMKLGFLLPQQNTINSVNDAHMIANSVVKSAFPIKCKHLSFAYTSPTFYFPSTQYSIRSAQFYPWTLYQVNGDKTPRILLEIELHLK